MPIFHGEHAGFGRNRRTNARFRIEVPVQLRMPSGTKHGKLCDLSESGAKIMLDSPPPKGAPVLLAWDTHEVFCTTIWVAEDSCGLQFERPIARAIVLETTGQDEGAHSGPVANRSNIPMGQKRLRPGSGG
jgi:PilZ domain